MADKNTYYECKCEYGGLILCKTRAEWEDTVNKTIQEHRVYEFTCVTKSKSWSRPKTTAKLILIKISIEKYTCIYIIKMSAEEALSIAIDNLNQFIKSNRERTIEL